MQSNYPFLKQMQATESAKARNEIRRLRRELAQIGGPMSYLGNTGYGGNGKLEPEKPTNMVRTAQGNFILDEGEDVYKLPSGNLQVMPASQSQKPTYKMQTGGIIPTSLDPAKTRYGGVTNSPLPPATPITNVSGSPLEIPGANVPFMQTQNVQPGRTTVAPEMPSVSFLGTPARTALAPQPESVTATPMALPTGIAPQPQSVVGPQLAVDYIPTATRTGTAPKPAATTAVGGTTIPKVGEAPKPESVIGPELSIPIKDYSQGIPIGDEPGTVAETGTPTTEAPTGPDYEAMGLQALSGLQKYTQGMTPADKQYLEYLRGVRKGEAAAARGSLEQTMAQLGYTAQEAMIERAMQDRAISSQNNALLQQYGKEMGERAFAAAQLMPAEVRAAERMSMERTQFKNDEAWNTYDRLLQAGDYEGAAAQFKQITGSNIDVNSLKEDRDFLTRTRELGIDSQTIANDSARVHLTSDQYVQVASFANMGFTREEINRVTGLNLSPEDFNSIYDKTSMGQRDYDRRLAAVNTLISAGGEGNLTQAATMLNELYSGIDIDFSNIIKAENTANFVQGMDFLTNIAKSTENYDTAKTLLSEAGVGDLIGVDDAALEKLYNETKLLADPLRQVMSAVEDETLMELFSVGAEEVPELRRKLNILSTFGVFSMDEDGKWGIDWGKLEGLETMFGVDFGMGERPETPAPTPASLLEEFLDDPVLGTWDENKLNDTLLEQFQAAYPNPEDHTAEKYRQWFNEEGIVSTIDYLVKTTPLATFDLPVNGASVTKYKNAWMDLGFNSEQLVEVAKKPKYKAVLNYPLTGSWQEIKDQWNSQLGKLVLLDGKPYMVGGLGAFIDLDSGAQMIFGDYLNANGLSVRTNADGSLTTYKR